MGITKRSRKPKQVMTNITVPATMADRIRSMKKYYDQPLYEVLEKILDSGEELEMAQSGNKRLVARVQTMASDIDNFIEILRAQKQTFIPEKMLFSDDTRYRMKREGINFIKIKDGLIP